MKRVTLASALLLALSANLHAMSGQEVYNGSCKGCHVPGLMGAPKMNKAAWGPRLEKSVDELTATVISGKPPMPPGGGCKDCNADDLKAGVEYMLEQLQ